MTPVLLGFATPATRALAESLDAEMLVAPTIPLPSGWDWDWRPAVEVWADELGALSEPDGVVVCTWGTTGPARAFADIDPVGWLTWVEQPLALWYTTVTAAADRCVDGGSVVVVVERPAALDTPGRSAEVTVGEGMLSLTRSAALAHGARGVRINAVVTEVFTAPGALLGMAPPLAAFPGSPDGEVAGAVRMLLSSDAVGVTGTAVRADCGRSWA